MRGKLCPHLTLGSQAAAFGVTLALESTVPGSRSEGKGSEVGREEEPIRCIR